MPLWQEMEVDAPAKINLSFRVLRRREDGFHEIETLMAPISLKDTILIEEGDAGIQLDCDRGDLPLDSRNLAVRAAEMFYSETRIAPRLKMFLRKRIPSGAGLGGGSSDAASVLVALDRWHLTGLSPERLLHMASDLGSDVPFFLGGGAAWCRGRGELVEPVTLPERLPLLLLKPFFGVPTPWAYSRWKGPGDSQDDSSTPQHFRGLDVRNDLERPVFEKYLFLRVVKNWLLQQPEVAVALMSGSGSTVFAVLHENAAGEHLAERAQTELDPKLWTLPCHTIKE